jgi:hypothetical protein
MFRFWLNVHPILVLLVLLFVFALAGGAVHWLQCRSRLRAACAKRALTAPTFVAVSTLFALYAGFLLAQVIGQKNEAMRAVQAESAALQSLAIDGAAAGGNAAIRAAVGAYARSVIADEWPQLVEESGSTKTGQALFALMRAVRDAGGAELASSVHGQMLALVQKIAEARATRIAVVSNHLQQLGWTALFLLGFITQFGLGLAHLDRPEANRMAIGFFSAGAVIAMWLIAIQDNPFRGPNSVSAAPIAEVVAALGTG